MITIVTKPVFWTQIMLKDVTVFYNVCGQILISWNSTTAIHVSQSSRIFCLIYTVYERKNIRKLALSNEILLKVDKAARYIGGEVNSVEKDKKDVAIRVVFSFPDVQNTIFLPAPFLNHLVLFAVISYLFICIILYYFVLFKLKRDLITQNKPLTKGHFWPPFAITFRFRRRIMPLLCDKIWYFCKKQVFMQSISYLIILLMVTVRFPDGYCWYFSYSVMEWHIVLHGLFGCMWHKLI